jgi:putative ubiquitin-RnfH superfamily antitoxin RatB of RatAB toxin-antitoxin module
MTLSVTLVYSPAPRSVRELVLALEPGTTVGQALQASGWLAELSATEIKTLEVGVWGRKVALAHKLRAHDRIELYRSLTVDPKVARRERFVRQGAKSAGLFAKRRAGAKAGY